MLCGREDDSSGETPYEEDDEAVEEKFESYRFDPVEMGVDDIAD